jgi:hypothetical protein
MAKLLMITVEPDPDDPAQCLTRLRYDTRGTDVDMVFPISASDLSAGLARWAFGGEAAPIKGEVNKIIKGLPKECYDALQGIGVPNG